MKYFSQREVRPRHNDSLAAERCWVPAVGTNRGESTALTLKYFLHLKYFQERVESLLEAFRPGRERERDKVRTRNMTYIHDSHWSSSYITALSLVESFRVLLRQLTYAIKNQLVASKAPY